jgi:uncharacterized membrane protein YccC
MSTVTGLLKGTFAYLAVWIVFCLFISPLKNALNDSPIILAIFGCLIIMHVIRTPNSFCNVLVWTSPFALITPGPIFDSLQRTL